MPPSYLLCGLLLLTAAVVVANRYLQRRKRAAYRQLAILRHMHYSPYDPLRLTPRVAAQIPVPGASAVRVIDLLYRTDEQLHHYIFTAEYTVGVAGPKHRLRRAAAFSESKSAAGAAYAIRMGPAELPLIEQYKVLMEL